MYYYIMVYCAMPYHIIVHSVLLYSIALYFTISDDPTLSNILPYYIKYDILYTLCYIQ